MCQPNSCSYVMGREVDSFSSNLIFTGEVIEFNASAA